MVLSCVTACAIQGSFETVRVGGAGDVVTGAARLDRGVETYDWRHTNPAKSTANLAEVTDLDSSPAKSTAKLVISAYVG